MLKRITNRARDYAWGSATLIPELLGIPATGGPMAEIWFGTHPGSPSRDADSGLPLDQLLGGELGFLLKILAAAEPLSIQVHPNRAQAERGFASEEAATPPIPIEQRNYRDPSDKPEMLIALSDGFEALCGFRPRAEQVEILREAAGQTGPRWSARFSGWADALLAATEEAAESILGAVMTELLHLNEDELAHGDLQPLWRERSHSSLAGEAISICRSLWQRYPLDPGVLVALLLNHVTLNRHEAISLPAGNLHAYLSGIGVEVMSASDNVLRAGLTKKHIDRDALLAVVQFHSLSEPKVASRRLSAGLWQYPSPSESFDLYRLEPSDRVLLAELAIAGTGILVVTSGELSVSSSRDERLTLARGQAAVLSGASHYSFGGSGTAFLATGALA